MDRHGRRRYRSFFFLRKRASTRFPKYPAIVSGFACARLDYTATRRALCFAHGIAQALVAPTYAHGEWIPKDSLPIDAHIRELELETETGICRPPSPSHHDGSQVRNAYAYGHTMLYQHIGSLCDPLARFVWVQMTPRPRSGGCLPWRVPPKGLCFVESHQGSLQRHRCTLCSVADPVHSSIGSWKSPPSISHRRIRCMGYALSSPLMGCPLSA